LNLPHRYPFRFVDRVVDGRGWVRLTANSARGRAGDGWNVAWLVEAIAQAAALVLADGEPGAAGGELVLAAVDQAELTAAPDPGATLEVAVRLEGRFGRLSRIRGEVRQDGRPIGKAALVLAAS